MVRLVQVMKLVKCCISLETLTEFHDEQIITNAVVVCQVQ